MGFRPLVQSAGMNLRTKKKSLLSFATIDIFITQNALRLGSTKVIILALYAENKSLMCMEFDINKINSKYNYISFTH